MKRAKKPIYLTDEQLMRKLIRDAKKQTPEEKAAVRAELEKAFGKRNEPVTLEAGLEIFRRELEKRSRKPKVWIN